MWWVLLVVLLVAAVAVLAVRRSARPAPPPPHHPAQGARRTTTEDAIISTCPRCGAKQTLVSRRYVGHVCFDCVERATDAHGRRVRGFNTDLGGGFAAYYVEDDGSSGKTRCDEVTESHIVHIDGGRYWMTEARFGGTVVMPLAWAEQQGLPVPPA